MRILLISNQHARRGGEPLDPALGVFARAGMAVVEKRVERGRETPDLIQSFGDVDAVVLAGGDGTMHAAAPALLELGRPVGLLPRGTANDLARALGLPLDLMAAAEVIVAGVTRRIDVGEVNGNPFFNVAHIGLGAKLADSLSVGLKRRLGPLAYTFAAVRALAGLRPFRAEIVTGGERIVLRTISITIGNGRFFGGSGMVAEDAEIDDGLFHLFALTTRNPFRLLLMLPGIVRGRHGRSKWVHTAVGSEFEIFTTRKEVIRADGKVISETPAFFRMRPGALALFAPAPVEPLSTPASGASPPQKENWKVKPGR